MALLGYSASTVSSLGEIVFEGRRSELAGEIDRANWKVKISARFDQIEQRFTTAHELGHAVMQPNGTAIHRDLPVTGPTYRRSTDEAEADRFASAFLLPAKLVAQEFAARFGSPPFGLTEANSKALFQCSRRSIQRSLRSQRDLSLALATAGVYGSNFVVPMYKRFNVTRTTMAIRLEELELLCGAEEQ